MQKNTYNEYLCDMCGEINIKGWSDESADAEAKKLFGVEKAHQASGMALICDDCFQKINPLTPENKEIYENFLSSSPSLNE